MNHVNTRGQPEDAVDSAVISAPGVVDIAQRLAVGVAETDGFNAEPGNRFARRADYSAGDDAAFAHPDRDEVAVVKGAGFTRRSGHGDRYISRQGCGQ